MHPPAAGTPAKPGLAASVHLGAAQTQGRLRATSRPVSFSPFGLRLKAGFPTTSPNTLAFGPPRSCARAGAPRFLKMGVPTNARTRASSSSTIGGSSPGSTQNLSAGAFLRGPPACPGAGSMYRPPCRGGSLCLPAGVGAPALNLETLRAIAGNCVGLRNGNPARPARRPLPTRACLEAAPRTLPGACSAARDS